MTTSKTRILIAALLLALVASIVPMGAAPMASSGDVVAAHPESAQFTSVAGRHSGLSDRHMSVHRTACL